MVRDLILGLLLGKHKRGRYGGSNLGTNYDLLTTHRERVFLEKAIPRKQAKSLKNTPEGVHPK